MYSLGAKSKRKLEDVNPLLVRVVERAIQITEQDFTVLEGVRSYKRQEELYRAGQSKTMNSRHLTGDAVDLAPWPISWDWNKFYLIADAMKKAAEEEGVKVRWGGNWAVNNIGSWEGTGEELAKAYQGSFPDGPHFEIPR